MQELKEREYTEAEKQILYEYHNAPLGEHQGVNETKLHTISSQLDRSNKRHGKLHNEIRILSKK